MAISSSAKHYTSFSTTLEWTLILKMHIGSVTTQMSM